MAALRIQPMPTASRSIHLRTGKPPQFDLEGDRNNDQPGDGVAPDELGGAVHRAEEGGLLLQLLSCSLANP